jgi:hypothetical protein
MRRHANRSKVLGCNRYTRIGITGNQRPLHSPFSRLAKNSLRQIRVGPLDRLAQPPSLTARSTGLAAAMARRVAARQEWRGWIRDQPADARMDGRQLLVCDYFGKINPARVHIFRLILWPSPPCGRPRLPHSTPRLRTTRSISAMCWPRRSPCKASSRLPAKRANPQAALPHRRGGCETSVGPTSQIGSATDALANDRPPAILDLRQVDSPTRLHNGQKLTLSLNDRFPEQKSNKINAALVPPQNEAREIDEDSRG